MVQFRDYFTGKATPPFQPPIATTAQKCMRAGGKHNDLDNVGHTARHHTLFEMLGNFSFGAYFKEEAIRYAWEFLTKTVGLPESRLAVSVFRTDDEAAAIWRKVTGWKDDSRIFRRDEADNFWSMGDTGPCGPCTEIFWDQGKEVDGDRWLEIWNLVFMQYERVARSNKSSTSTSATPQQQQLKQQGGFLSDPNFELRRLARPCVDTGMGLERIAAVLQGVPTNYDTDTLKALILAAQEVANSKRAEAGGGRRVEYKDGLSQDQQSVALKVIADHLRAASFLLADGVVPSNVGRGYVLRRIIRRAVTYGTKLGLKDPFMASLVPALVEQMGSTYPELRTEQKRIETWLQNEEQVFGAGVAKGLKYFENSLSKLSGKVVPGSVAFLLHDSFSFPLDLTQLIAREKGLTVDEKEFDRLLEEQRSNSRAAHSISSAASSSEHGSAKLPAEIEQQWRTLKPKFTGYDKLVEPNARVLGAASTPEAQFVCISPCPFYAASGGQIGDHGWLEGPDGHKWEVLDTIKPFEGGIVLCLKKDDAAVKVGSTLKALVDPARRRAAAVHHTATHLLNAALRNTLGVTVSQAGSLVAPDRLRFDFTYTRPLKPEELVTVEQWVNRAAESDAAVGTAEMPKQEALKKNAVAMFTETYGDVVRVVEVPGFSTELCGGTHVKSIGELYPFRILSEGAIASGVRRIEALAGKAAVKYLTTLADSQRTMARELGVPISGLEARVLSLRTKLRETENKLSEQKMAAAKSGTSQWAAREGTYKASGSSAVPVVLYAVPEAESNDMAVVRARAFELRDRRPEAVHVALCEQNGRCSVFVSDQLRDRGVKATEIWAQLAASKDGPSVSEAFSLAVKGGGKDLRTATGVVTLTTTSPASLKLADALLTKLSR